MPAWSDVVKDTAPMLSTPVENILFVDRTTIWRIEEMLTVRMKKEIDA